MRAKVRHLIEQIIISVGILGLAIANLWHVVGHFPNRPSHAIFIGITHHYEDYFYYLSQLTQGAQGNWTVRNLYTSEPIPGTLLWFPNLLLGKIGLLLGLYPWITYDVAVFTISVISLLSIYTVIKLLVPQNAPIRVASFFIATMSTVYYLLEKNPDGSVRINPYQYFYNYTEAFNRLGGVFHLILQNVLTLAIIVLASRIMTEIKKSDSIARVLKDAIILSVCSTTLFFINPLYVIVDAIAILLVAIPYLLMHFRPRIIPPLLASVVMISVPVGSAAYYIFTAFQHPFYQYFRTWESTIQPTNMYIFFHSMGFIVLFAIVGLIPYVRKPTLLRILGIVYTITPIALYFSPLPERLGIPYFRLHQPPAYAFLGVAAAEGMMFLSTLCTPMGLRRMRLGVFLAIVGLYLLFQLPMLRVEIRTRFTNYTLSSELNYWDPDIHQALLFLRTKPRDKVAIGINNIELLIPVVSGHTVYAAHRSLTVNYNQKMIEIIGLLHADYRSDQAYLWLTSRNIGYIVVQKRDADIEKLRASYPFLKTLFENQKMVVLGIL